MIGSVCQKSLVLPNAQFEHETGYLQSALLPFLRQYYARVEWLDYENHDEALVIAEDFLNRIADRKLMESLKRD